jgi:hypothetical protein
VALSNIDSRQASNEQHRFKNPFARIRLFQNLIPQLHFGDFFNTIDPFRTSTRLTDCWPRRCHTFHSAETAIGFRAREESL